MIWILIICLIILIYYDISFDFIEKGIIIYYGRKKRKEIIWQIK